MEVTYVSRSEQTTVWRERQHCHDALVVLKDARLLERFAVPVVQTDLLILLHTSSKCLFPKHEANLKNG